MTADIPTYPEVTTLADLPFHVATRFNRPAHLRRCLAEGFYEISSKAFYEQIRAFSLGLQTLGVAAGDRVGIVCESRPEWSIADLAALTIGAVTVPVYPTLSAAQTQFILQDAGVKAVVVSDKVQLAKLLDIARDLPTVTAVIPVEATAPFHGAATASPAVRSMAEVTEVGSGRLAREAGLAEQWADGARRVKPSDVATIIYTSGTTGHPKGVVLSHDNMLANLRAGNASLQITDQDYPLSFLPLSHVFERLALYLYLLVGAHVSFAESLQTVTRDIVRVRPTMMTGVPRVFEKFHHAVLDAVAGGPAVRKALFKWAMGVAYAVSDARIAGRKPPILAALQRPLADALVLKKIRARVGGRLRLMVSGSAPLSRTTGAFFYAVGLPISECYGLTESSPGLTANPPWAPKLGTVGKPIPGVEIRIAEDGEVLARGPNIMQGYLNRPDETAAALRDGWLHTGDIGHLDRDGYLMITDRKKDLIVTSGGKNIAPAPIEMRLKASPLVQEAILVGDRRKFPAVLIVPDFVALEAQVREAGAPSGSREQLAGREDVQAIYQALLDEINVDLAQFEKIKRFALLPTEMTIEAGELTPTLKIRRKIVEQRWAHVIEQLYASRDPLLSAS
ncbi:MAG: long-chain fatty acid--CoA ligase [Acidobacteria bacterium]|nr:long-chain fatty acid--CoA ligase [Acidobacteriota bacterium]